MTGNNTKISEDGRGGHMMFLLNSLTIGGSERKTVRIANALATRGGKLTIAYLNGPHTLRDEVMDGITVLCLDRKGKFDVGALRRLIGYVSQNKIDFICCINLYPLIYAYLSRLSLGIARFKVLAAVNTTTLITRKEKWQMHLFAPILRRVDKVIFGSMNQKNLWVEQFKLDATHSMVIYNGVDVDYFRKSNSASKTQVVRAELGIPATSVVIGSIGRFRKVKQYEVAIQACVDLKNKMNLDVHCVLVGGGVEKQRLTDLVVELASDSYIHILDAADDVRHYLESMDIFVLSSISETFSNAALEAMAMELPVVLPNVGGCPEMVKPGITGFIYESGVGSQFVEQLYLLCSDKNRREIMGQEARRFVEEAFRFESMIESYKNLVDLG